MRKVSRVVHRLREVVVQLGFTRFEAPARGVGGLVQVGKKLGHHLDAALELGRLCSNDPDHAHEERFLHGAACHGCLLVSEPSCEWSNELLDRSLVVETVEDAGAAFFAEG